VLGGLGVRNEDVQLDLVSRSDACRRSQVHARVADRGRDPGQGPGFVLELYDQVERNRRPPPGLRSPQWTLPEPAVGFPCAWC
jgi:hypothetical protein